ncbi:MAG: flagellar hook-associated protein FlgK [Pikeienuella sp.]
MSIANALNNALSGLRANGRQADVTAGNLANALTPGYGRQEVDLVSAVSGGQGTGVKVAGITRVLDIELSSARRMADGELADATAKADALRKLETEFGSLGGVPGLAARLASFEGALRDLAETPENAPAQVSAAEAASDLALAFNELSRSLTDLRAETDREIGRVVSETNTALERIAQLNRDIQLGEATGRNSAALIDAREREIDVVARAVPIRRSERADGVVELTTREGIGLVDIRAYRIDYAVTPVYAPGLSYDGGSGPLSGLSLRGLDITPGGPGPQQVRGGALAGLFSVRDAIAPEAEAQFDSLAADLITRLADPAIDPTLAPGDPGLFTDGGSAFDLANIEGIAGRIGLNAAVDPRQGGEPAKLRDGINAAAPGPSGNDDLVRAMSDALSASTDAAAPPATPGLSGNLSLAERLDGVAELLGGARVVAEAAQTRAGAGREALANEEATELGVDSDRELSRLVEIEQAYAANAQVIQVAARMLDELRRIQ